MMQTQYLSHSCPTYLPTLIPGVGTLSTMRQAMESGGSYSEPLDMQSLGRKSHIPARGGWPRASEGPRAAHSCQARLGECGLYPMQEPLLLLATGRAGLRKATVMVRGMQQSYYTYWPGMFYLCFHSSMGSPEMVPSIMEEGQRQSSLGSKMGRSPLELRQKVLWFWGSTEEEQLRLPSGNKSTSWQEGHSK